MLELTLNMASSCQSKVALGQEPPSWHMPFMCCLMALPSYYLLLVLPDGGSDSGRELNQCLEQAAGQCSTTSLILSSTPDTFVPRVPLCLCCLRCFSFRPCVLNSTLFNNGSVQRATLPRHQLSHAYLLEIRCLKSPKHNLLIHPSLRLEDRICLPVLLFWNENRTKTTVWVYHFISSLNFLPGSLPNQRMKETKIKCP